MHKRPGGRIGHKGVSRKHKPDRTIRLEFNSKTQKCCGRDMRKGERTRDIIDVIIKTEEIRYVIETATCEHCKRTCEAENDLPKKGSYSKNAVRIIAELRAALMTDSNMALVMKNLFEIHVAKSTVVNMQKRIAQSMETSASDIYKKATESSHVHMDETSISFNGITMWIWLTWAQGKGVAEEVVAII